MGNTEVESQADPVLQARNMAGVEQVEEIELASMQQLSFIEVESSESLNRGMDEIPDQLEFKIGTAANLVGVKPYVLRFWETEFDGLRPKKSRKGQRVYSRRDVETAMFIKKLLYEDRFSIEGARSRLRELRSKVKEERVLQAQSVEVQKDVLSEALLELYEICDELSQFKSLIA
jgi:DNA-binding transcriptional MerR regulator